MKTIFLSIFLLSAFVLSAQSFTTINGTDRFIEVKVSDTLHAIPDMIKVLVEIDDNSEDMDFYYDDDTDARDNDSKKRNMADNSKDKVEDALKRLKLDYTYHEKDKNSFPKDMSLYSGGFEVRLTSVDQIDLLNKSFAGMDDVTVNVMEASTSRKAEYELQLIDRLMKLAENEASVIAKSMGVTLDKPLNASNQTFDSLYGSMFDNPNSMGGLGALFSMVGSMFKSGGDHSFVVINKSLLVRYGIK